MMRALSVVLFALLVSGCVSADRSAFVGDYYSPQPCSLGSEYDLSLKADGSYRLIRTLPEGVGPVMPDGGRPSFEEVGRWTFDGVVVVLRSVDGKKMKLKLEIHDDSIVLAAADVFGLRLAKQRPNQTPEPTTLLGTSAAEQPLVPSRVVAHL